MENNIFVRQFNVNQRKEKKNLMSSDLNGS